MALSGGALAEEDEADGAAPLVERVYWDGPPDASGVLTGGWFEQPMAEVTRLRLANRAPRLATATPADNRLDLVFVGDGYTEPELGLFSLHADNVTDLLFSYDPLTTYRPYFRVTKVDVISPDSGVDNDPVEGIARATALNMGFWCGGTERALCVDVDLAWAAALTSENDVDQVIAIANSTKYGGVGYPSSNLGTVSGGNDLAADIAIHELGHSLGDLADEYDYGGPVEWSGIEPSEANVSTYEAPDMLARETKWTAWFDGFLAGFDGPISTYEGANYSVLGIYRPSPNSMMRSLGRPFNAPSAEALIGEIYREVTPIDSYAPFQAVVDENAILSVTPMQPIGHDLDITWELNQSVIPGATGTTLDVSQLGITSQSVIRVRVVDNTPMVRDERMRQTLLTDVVGWRVIPGFVEPCSSVDVAEPFAQIDAIDVITTLGFEPAGYAAPSDAFDFADVAAVLGLAEGGCEGR